MGGVVGGIIILRAIMALIIRFFIRRRTKEPSGMYDGGAPGGTSSIYSPTAQLRLYVGPQCVIVKDSSTLSARTRLILAHSPQTILFTPTPMLPKADLLVHTAVSQNFSHGSFRICILFCCGLIFLILTLHPPNASPLAFRRCGREMFLIFKLIHAVTKMEH